MNWDPSKSLPDDDRDTFRAGGNAAQRRKALRKAQGSRCQHGVLIVGDVDPEQKCSRCAAEMSAYAEGLEYA